MSIKLNIVVDASNVNQVLGSVRDELRKIRQEEEAEKQVAKEAADVKKKIAAEEKAQAKAVAAAEKQAAKEAADAKKQAAREAAAVAKQEAKAIAAAEKQAAKEAAAAAKQAAREAQASMSTWDKAFSGKVPDATADAARFKLAAIGGAITAGVMVVKGAISAVSSFVDASNVQELAIKQLGQTLQNTGRAIPIKEMTDFASEIQRTTTFGDEAVLGAVRMAAQYKQLSDSSLKEVIKTATDVAAVTGDLSSASKALAQALVDPETGMKKLRAIGVILTKDEKDRIKALTDSGKAEEARALILDKVSKQYKGQAELLASTTAGMTIQAKNLIGDMKESVGDAVKAMSEPLLQSLIPALKSVLSWFEQNKTGITKTAKIIGTVISSLITGIVSNIKITIRTISSAIQVGADAIIGGFGVIVSAVTVAIDAFKNLGTIIGDVFSGNFVKAVADAKGAITSLEGGWVKTGQKAKDLFSTIGSEIKIMTAENTKDAMAGINKLTSGIADALYVGDKGVGYAVTGGDTGDIVDKEKEKTEKLKSYDTELFKSQQEHQKELYRGDLAMLRSIDQATLEYDRQAELSMAQTEEQKAKINKIYFYKRITLNRKYYDEIVKMQDDSTPDDKTAEKVEKVADKYGKLQPIADDLTSSFSDFFMTMQDNLGKLINGTYDVKQAFNELGSSILSIFEKIIAETLAAKVVSGLFSLIGFSDGGIIPTGYASGGIIHAAAGTGILTGGVSGIDSIPILAMPGEAVIRKAAVDRIGAQGVAALNNGGSVAGIGGGLTVNQTIGYVISSGQQAVEVQRQALQKAINTYNKVIAK